ncbi:MAG: phosphosulfolactate synthase [Bacillota bacterium]
MSSRDRHQGQERTPKAWGGLVTPPLGGRSRPPRRAGVTMVIDKGMGLGETAGLLELAADYIDFWKLPFGTSAFYPEPALRKKLEMMRAANIKCYPGGTFLEVAIWQDRLEPFLRKGLDLGFTAMEVSDGTIPLLPEERERAIRLACELGFTVLSEVGKKDPRERIPWETMRRIIQDDLATGVKYVIVEGREMGRGVGIYGEAGQIIDEEVSKVLSAVRDPSLIVWEAPLKSQQEQLILRFGPNVNLGNVTPQEILALEALRTGLRADTLRASLYKT